LDLARERHAEQGAAATGVVVMIVCVMVLAHEGSILRTRHEALRRHPGL